MVAQLVILVGVVVAFANGDVSSLNNSMMLPKDTKNSCELPNGFKYDECGTVSGSKVCCAPEQQCISAKPKDGDEQFVCSSARKLSGDKVIKIILLPVVLAIAALGVAAYIVKFNVKDRMTALFTLQIVLSVFLFFSPLWTLGLYTVLLASFVAGAWKSNNELIWWAGQVVFVLQVFHVIAIFGPFETFHVPFGSLSTYKDAGAFTNNVEMMAGKFTSNVASCSAYYGGYFNLLPIERMAADVNPNQGTFGYCVEEWLGTVQFLCTILGVLQVASIFSTARKFLGSSVDAKETLTKDATV